MEITSMQNKLVKETVKLHQKKYRDKEGLFLIEGYHLLEEASKYGLIKTIFTTDRTIKGENVFYVTDQVLEKLANTKNTQKVVAVCYKPNNNQITNFVLILNKVQDPGNIGTLMRSSLAFGFETIVLDNTVDIYNPKVVRSTQGAMFKLNIVYMSAIDFIEKYPKYKIYGTSLNGKRVEAAIKTGKLALILGNEGNGVEESVLAKTDVNLTIPTKDVESLNVAVAGSILMHELRK